MSIILPPDGPFVLLDLETTGLNSGIHEIIQIGALFGEIGEGQALIYDEYESKVIPENIAVASPKALEVNHYDAALWKKEGKHAYSVLPELAKRMKGCTYIGYNNAFDLGFLRTAIGLEGLIWEEPEEQYDVLVEIGRPLSRREGTANARLDTLCDHMEIDYPAHDALGDVKRTWLLMWLGLSKLANSCVSYDTP